MMVYNGHGFMDTCATELCKDLDVLQLPQLHNLLHLQRYNNVFETGNRVQLLSNDCFEDLTEGYRL